jgi:GNAT superfamily N-acetyltransferase
MDIIVRKARAEDAAVAIETLRCSITELCQVDHHNDPEALKVWLANKTVEEWVGWVAHPDISMFVAEADGIVRGVGLITHAGEVRLNYVHPAVRFNAISRTLLNEMELTARQLGLKRCFLESTRTALPFYLACGYTRVTEEGESLSLEKALA